VIQSADLSMQEPPAHHRPGSRTAGALAVAHRELETLPRHEPLSHTDHVLTYIVRGWLRMDQVGALEAEAGSLLILPSGVPHEPLAGRGLELWIVRFCPSCFELDESQRLMSPFRSVRVGALPVVAIARDRQPRVVQLFADLEAEHAAGMPESPDLLRSLLQLLLAEVYRAMPGRAAPPSGSSTFVPEALAFIQRHALESISLRDVAAAVARAPAHVAATIKKQTGHTVGAWITSIRLAESASRLVHTDDSIAEIAERIGWRDQTHFIRQFRRAYGVTPAAWRAEHRTSHVADSASNSELTTRRPPPGR
jgi:AraC-like DNA-binding protein